MTVVLALAWFIVYMKGAMVPCPVAVRVYAFADALQEKWKYGLELVSVVHTAQLISGSVTGFAPAALKYVRLS